MATLKGGYVKNSGTSKDRAVKGYSVECAIRGDRVSRKGSYGRQLEVPSKGC